MSALLLTALGALVKGGAGSGNFGHAGRPGEQGGSGAGGGTTGSTTIRGSGDELHLSRRDAAGHVIGGADVVVFPDALLVAYIHLNPSARGLGHGKALMRDIITQANRRGITKITGESPSESFRRMADPLLGTPVLHGDPNYLKNETEGVEAVYTIPPSLRSPDGLAKGGAGSGNFGHAGRPGEQGGSTAGSGGGGGTKSSKGVYELGVITSSGAVTTARIPEDELGITQHGDAGLQMVAPEQRFRFADGDIQWNDVPSLDDYFKVDDHYANYKGVAHTVFDGNYDFRPLSLDEVRSHDATITKGGVGSGNFGHAGRPGEQGGSGPGGGSAGLSETSREAIAHVGTLVDKALSYYSNVPGEQTHDWSDLPHTQQNEAFHAFASESGVDVDTSDLDKETESDLRRDNEEVIAATETETLSALSEVFPDTNPTLPLGEGQGVALFHTVDPETIEYGDDDGEGAQLNPSALRFTNGKELTTKEQALVVSTWNASYQKAFEKELTTAFESDAYFEQKDTLELEQVQSEWNDLSDSQKMEYVETPEFERSFTRLPAGAPTRWMSGIGEDEDNASEDYLRTQAVAATLTALRANEIAAARGIGEVDTETLAAKVWDNGWKESSSSPAALAMQLAVSNEFGGVHRLTPDELTAATNAAYALGGMPKLQAYARAQWETTQFVLDKSGIETAQVYRAIYLPTDQLTDTRRDLVDKLGGPVASANPAAETAVYTRLPNIMIQRGGAQSTTSVASVANSWSVDLPTTRGNLKRVVLRIEAPRSSVLSLPVYGRNIKSEHEVVLAGMRDKWTWDAWEGRAPDFGSQPIAKGALMKAQKKPILVDLQAIDRGQPNWLKGVPPREAREASAEILARIKRAREAKPVIITAVGQVIRKGGPGSGNFGHTGRPGEIGGSGEGGGGEFLASPSDAIGALVAGERVSVSANHVRGTVERALRQNVNADLSRLTIEGTPVFAGGTNISRANMPQIPDDQVAGFLQHLKDKGIDIKRESVPPMSLIATQKEIDAKNVAHKLAAYDKGKFPVTSIMVSKDNFVLDGHHRWAALAVADADAPRAKILQPITRIMVPRDKALSVMRAYTKAQGIANRAFGKSAFWRLLLALGGGDLADR